jgi:23S rRNA (cytosine1962-C5)-methyltransferase
VKIELPEIANGEDKSSDFVNCIRNSYRHVRKWAKRTVTNCFRIYDRQMYHYPFAIDFYAGRYLVHYFSPHREEDEPPKELVDEIENALCDTFGTNRDMIYWRYRIKRQKYEQYEKAAETKEFFTVLEYGAQFKVNLVDYLDTGLFLDHRESRRFIASQCKEMRLLNLFAYTSSFSVHAALQGAVFTKSVDMSNTYCEWSQDNFILNGLSRKNNEVVRADCLKFLDEEIDQAAHYDIIVIDPPTISRSKKMEQMFDIQLDYIFLITKALSLLRPGGFIFFSTNSRKFVFDQTIFPSCSIVELSQKIRPIDFHDPKIHQAWKICPK